MKNNPYSLLFGKKPNEMISRTTMKQTIMNAFSAPNPSQQVFMLSGVRGAGKTVVMTDLSKSFENDGTWIVTELNTERDMLVSLASKLTSRDNLAKLFQSASINLSFFGLGLSVTGTAPITDIETALEEILKVLKKHGKRVLITVDDVTNNQNIRTFANTFQILIRKDLPIFLLMTGLYENIDDLQNEKNMTFLHRAPKIPMKPLNIGTIAENYSSVFHLKTADALTMAKMTKGYSFAFQVLGYFTWENGGFNQKTISDFRQYLEENVYEKIWSELSAEDKRIANAIANTPGGKISEIRNYLDMETNRFNPYRKRLIRKGIIDGDTYGYLFFTLPLFDQFIIENYDL